MLLTYWTILYKLIVYMTNQSLHKNYTNLFVNMAEIEYTGVWHSAEKKLTKCQVFREEGSAER